MNRIFIQLGPISIYWYSIMILLAIICALFIIYKEAKKENLTEFINDIFTPIILFGILGARIYYVIFNFDEYKYDLLSIFKIWEGGLAIYGGIIAGFITLIYFSKKKKVELIKATDLIIPGLILAQAIGRWGNFFNQEAHGPSTSLEYLQSIHIPNFIIKGMYINGSYYEPTFFYESLWCLLGFTILLIIRKIIKNKKGLITYSYFIWYGIGRFIIEQMRTDSLYIGSFKVSQLVSLFLIIVGLSGIIYNFIHERSKNDKKI